MTAARSSGDGSGLPQITAMLLGIVAFGLGFRGLYVGLPPEMRDLADVAYRALQLFVLDGAALDQITVGDNWWLQTARFLAPLVTVLALLLGVRALLADRFRRARIRRFRNHVVVCGGSDVALALARNLHDCGRCVVLVREAGPGAFPLSTVDGDPRRPATLVQAGIGRAEQVYACSASSALNAAVALTAGALRRPGSARLVAVAQVGAEDLVDALRVRRLATAATRGGALDFFTLDDVAAHTLLNAHPVDAGTPVVVVMGFGPFGQAVVRTLLRQPGEQRLLHVVTAEVSAATSLAERLGAADRGWDVRVGPEPVVGSALVYVCLSDDDRALATALKSAREPGRQVVLCLRAGSPFREALGREEGLRVFGIVDEACRAEAIAAGLVVVRTARAIHQGYVEDERARGDDFAANPSVAAWEDLPEHLRMSNHGQAEHIGEKLIELGASLTSQPPEPPFVFTHHELERLASLEHQRWMDERLAAGFEYGSIREERRSRWLAWLPRRLYPGHRFHPDLVGWSELSPESRRKDVEAVRRLPALLAAEGLYIERSRESSDTGCPLGEADPPAGW